MLRISAVFIAICMVLISGSIGAMLYLAFGVDAAASALIALAALTGMALYNTISSRLRDRGDLGDQIADLSRGTADLARQVAEIGRRLGALESRGERGSSRAPEQPRGAPDALAGEISELGGLVRQIAETVATHESEIRKLSGSASAAAASASQPAAGGGELKLSEADTVSGVRRFRGMSREGVAAMIASAVAANRLDLYLQPIVTLPQRKVRFYEALARLRTPEGDIVPASDFIEYAEGIGLMPKIDNLMLFRCVQVMRRLQMKNRDVGLFCNISAATLADATAFKQALDFMEANRALASSLMFEFTQSAYRAFGPLEHESLAALTEHGFHFSMDHVGDLRMEPKDLADRGFRFLKVPAKLLLNRSSSAQSDIHPADLADLLARSGIDLVAERVESESMVIDLLDYDVRFGQGFLFSPPRPVRAEALGSEGEKAQAGDAPGELIAADSPTG